jgi:hypothetical protein
MKTRVQNLSKGLAIFLVLGLIATAGAGFLEAGICWDAFLRCLDDPINQLSLGGPVICFGGVSFCYRFIESLM